MGIFKKLFKNGAAPCYLTPMLGPAQYSGDKDLSRGVNELIWKLPLLPLKKRLLTPVITERIVEIPFVLRNLPPAPCKVLDFGSTSSPLVLEMASIGYKVTGVDLRPYGFTHPNLEFYIGDFAERRSDPDAYDAVTAVSSVEHCGLESYGASTKESGDKKIVGLFRKILKPKGVLLLTVPYGRRGENEGYRVYDKERLEDLLEGFELRQKLLYAWNPEEQWVLSDESGLKDVDCLGPRVRGVALVIAVKP
ncbi:MAG: hypothetical protein A2X35_02000 [Elusimicrobia bacterium GWA2_61_42]|nr:MAG: hypothetical protein A2X35_02000 [Elusimicrobia bacterium GWA2_61_42]OGR78708.1 MAG: hypothetical protein A2X38_03940 [Elusimicrobia bacterium GWC2_61_25]